MKIILDDWLVIIERDGYKRIFNTEMWLEWGNVGVLPQEKISLDYKLDKEQRVIESALYRFLAEYPRL